jgi:hypothetical protein
VIEDWLWIKVIRFRETLSIASRAYKRNVLRVHGRMIVDVCSRTQVDEDFSVVGEEKDESVRIENKRR